MVRRAVLLPCFAAAALACTEQRTDPGGGELPPPAACLPATCADVGGACGSFLDGCGGEIVCGCGALETCVGASCVPLPPSPGCSPLFSSCGEIGRTCGDVLNGCNEPFSCGTCAAGETCSAGGRLGNCAEPPVENPRPLWLSAVGTSSRDRAIGIVRTPDGGAVLLWWAEADRTLRLDWVTPSGTRLLKGFRVSSTSSGEHLFLRTGAVPAPDGTLYVHLEALENGSAEVDLGDGPRKLPLVAQLRADGELLRVLCAGVCGGAVIAADARGSFVWRGRTSEPGLTNAADANSSVTVLHRADGVRVPIAGRVFPDASGPLASDACGSATFAGEHLVCGGHVPGEVEYGRYRYAAPNPSLAKLDLSGTLLWSRSVPGIEGLVTHVGATARGTIVASGQFSGFGRFGDEWLDHRRELPMAEKVTMVLAVEPDGAPRWARQLGGRPFAMSVAPEGRVALALGGELGSHMLAVLDLAGALLVRWRYTRAPWTHWRPLAAGPDDVLMATEWNGDLEVVPGPAGIPEIDIAVLSIPF